MGDILTLAKKFERAMRNGTGFQITSDEVIAAVEDDVLDAIHAAKLKRLKQQCLGNPVITQSEIIGLASDVTESQRLGRSPDTPPVHGPTYIARLGLGT